MQQTNAARTPDLNASDAVVDATSIEPGSGLFAVWGDTTAELAAAEAELARAQAERIETQRERDRLMALVFGQG